MTATSCPACGAPLRYAYAHDGAAEEIAPGFALCFTCLRLLVVTDDLRVERCSREARLLLSSDDQRTIDDMTLHAARLRLPADVADTFQMGQATIDRIDDMMAYAKALPLSNLDEPIRPEAMTAELPGGYNCMFAVVTHNGEELRFLRLHRLGAKVPAAVVALVGRLFGFTGDPLSWARPCRAFCHVTAIQRIATWEITSPGGGA